MFKKLSKLMAVILLMFTVFPCTLAAENEDIDLSGYSEEDKILILDMIQNNPEFDLSEGEVVAIDQVILKLDEKDGLLKGAIGSDYMKLTVVAQRVNGSSGYDTFKLQATADWLKTPYSNFTDGFAIAWSDSFSQYSHSCNPYYVNGYQSGKTVQVSSSPSAGIGYSVPIMNGQQNPLDYVVLTAYVRKLDSSGVATVSALYVHSKISLSIGFSFSGPEISFSTVGLTDQVAADKSFTY